MYIVAAQKRGIPPNRLGGTLQNDILKEYTAQNEYIFPPRPSMRLVVDTIEFATRHMPLWNPISVSGYHIREAGSTAVQELAFTLANGMEYVRWCLDRGLRADEVGPRISFFFNVHNDFFEEVAKFRAARRLWARQMREGFGAANPRSWWMRFHAQTAGCALTAQEPANNIVRVALQSLAAVLGGAQSLHTNSLDEAWALPSQEAALVALRTQQIIAHETGVTDTVDPLGGSYYLETLTNEVEQLGVDYFRRIDAEGGVLPAVEKGFFVREIAEAAYQYQQEVERKERVVVGVNEYVGQEAPAIPLLRINEESRRRHLERLQEVRRRRSSREVREKLQALERAARGRQNVMPPLLEAVAAYCTLGEMTDAFREVFGVYQEQWAV
jgi:methylmalonyl-CoA mutase N-terminal domain/subunit